MQIFVRCVRFFPAGATRTLTLSSFERILEGLYVGFEHYIPIEGTRMRWQSRLVLTRAQACRNIAEFAFDYAARNGRKKVTIVHKANVLKALTGIFLETAARSGRRTKAALLPTTASSMRARCKLVLDPGSST
jgi:isocitrate dehydrogenase (NAD+)